MPKAKETKKKKGSETKELLDLNDPLAITVKFGISEITMKNDWRWKIKFVAHERLPEVRNGYKVRLEFDDRPFLSTIEQYEADAKAVHSNPTLLPDVDKKTIKDIDRRIAKTREDMEKLKSECIVIDFTPQTEAMKYKDNDTQIVFAVIDSVVDALNSQKFRLNNYRAILTPLYSNN